MTSMRNDRWLDLAVRFVGACSLLALLSSCTTQQYYEGMKAGRRAQCLEYPESEFERCVEETMVDYQEYREKRGEIVGD